jgi:hypothetical protein
MLAIFFERDWLISSPNREVDIKNAQGIITPCEGNLRTKWKMLNKINPPMSCRYFQKFLVETVKSWCLCASYLNSYFSALEKSDISEAERSLKLAIDWRKTGDGWAMITIKKDKYNLFPLEVEEIKK